MSARVVCVGDLGTAVTAMCPSGTVALDGRRVDARTEAEAIPAGASVVVLRGDPTGYVVRRVGPDYPMPTLPNAGEEIARAEFQRTSAEVRRAEARDEDERRREWDATFTSRIQGSAVAGGIFGWLWYSAAGAGGVAAACGAGIGLILAIVAGRLGHTSRWSPVCGHAAVFAGLLVAAQAGQVVDWAGDPLLGAAWVGGGALVGFAAGWWVATRLEMVFGGPDEV